MMVVLVVVEVWRCDGGGVGSGNRGGGRGDGDYCWEGGVMEIMIAVVVVVVTEVVVEVMVIFIH